MLKLAIIFASAVVASNLELNTGDFVNQINHAQNLWKAAPNSITEKGIAFIKRLSGTKHRQRKRPFTKGMPNVQPVNKVAMNIPESFDARTKWPECKSISAIKEQGNCGACWAIAAAGAISDRLCIQSNFRIRVNISVENLMSCCTDCIDLGSTGCEGGSSDKAWEYFQKSGLVTGGDFNSEEGCQPYGVNPNPEEGNVYTPKCQKRCTNKKYKLRFYKDKHYGKTSYQVAQSEAAIQTDILTYGPAEADFSVYLDFVFYSSGIYVKSSEEKLFDHSVKLIGWGVENSVKYWLAVNSWGSHWGESGTFRIRRGSNECAIESYVIAGLIRK